MNDWIIWATFLMCIVSCRPAAIIEKTALANKNDRSHVFEASCTEILQSFNNITRELEIFATDSLKVNHDEDAINIEVSTAPFISVNYDCIDDQKIKHFCYSKMKMLIKLKEERQSCAIVLDCEERLSNNTYYIPVPMSYTSHIVNNSIQRSGCYLYESIVISHINFKLGYKNEPVILQ